MDIKNLTYGRVAVFWVPLAAQWLMMSAEGPLLSAIIARMAEPKFNLAAYGVALSLALISESPIIMLMAASTTLVKDRQSFVKLRRFTLFLNVSITVFMLVLVLPSVFTLVVVDLIGLPEKVAHLVHISVILMLPWPAAIGYRRFLHGILIRHDRTRFIAYGTVIRLIVMALTAYFLFLFRSIPGAYVAASAMALGVICETSATRLMTGGIIRKILAEPDLGTQRTDLTYRAVNRFYVPLALTTILTLGVRPLITVFLGQSRMPLDSLAVLPVVHSLVFIFLSFGLSFQEVGIALLGPKFENYRLLRNFAFFLFCGTVGALSLISFTPLSYFWFHHVSGLSLELTVFSITPLMIMTALPGLAVIMFFQRSILMSALKTVPLTWATGIEVSVILVSLAVSIHYLDQVGIIAAAAALVAGSLASNSYLLPRAAKALKQFGRVAN